MIRSVVVTLAAATLLTACVGGSDPKPAPTKSPATVAPQAGDCYSGADSKLDDADPDFATKVTCTKPHLYEVTGTSPVPGRYLDAPDATIRDRLLEPDGPREESFARYATTTCRNHVWRGMGVDIDDVRSGGRRLSEIGATPAAAGVTYQHTLTPEPTWTKGERELICFAEFRDPQVVQGPAAPAAVSSYNLRPVAEKFLGSHFPPERRRCLVDSVEDGQQPKPCSQAHDAEVIFTYNARLAFGMPFVKEMIRDSRRDDKVFARLAKVCSDILPKVLGRPIARDLFVWGWASLDVYPGWELPSDQTSGFYDFPVECQVWPVDDNLVLAPGTVVHRPDRPELEDRLYRSDT